MSQTASATQRPFVISRLFDAPRDVVWKANTEADRLQHWWRPTGFTNFAAKLDLRPGGIFHYGLRSPDGFEMWGKLTYREISPPDRIVSVVSFSDAQGGITRHPMAPTWPIENLSTTTFAAQGDKTLITVSWCPINATPEEQQAFDAGHDSMRQGFTGTFDQLADYLAKA